MTQIAAFRYLLFWTLLVLIIAGCHQATQPHGPLYIIKQASYPPGGAPVAVTITDARPADERTFQDGSTDPVDFENAVDLITLENFSPHPQDLLKDCLTHYLADLPSPPSWADVELTHFQCRVNRQEILAAEYRRQLRMSASERMEEQDRLDREYRKALAAHNKAMKEAKKSGKPPPPLPPSPPHYIHSEDSASMGVGMGLGVGSGVGSMAQSGIAGVVTGITAGVITAAIAEDMINEKIQAANWNGVSSGVTCDISCNVTLHWKDGRQETFPVQTQSRSFIDPETDSHITSVTRELKLQVAPTVTQAIDRVGMELVNLISPADLGDNWNGNASLRQFRSEQSKLQDRANPWPEEVPSPPGQFAPK